MSGLTRARWGQIGACAAALESLAFAAGGAVLTFAAIDEAFSHRSTKAGLATDSPIAVDVFIALMAFGMAGALAWGARGMWRGTGAGRGFLLTWQVLQLGVAVQTLRDKADLPMTPGVRWTFGFTLLAVALVVLAGWVMGSPEADPGVEADSQAEGQPEQGQSGSVS